MKTYLLYFSLLFFAFYSSESYSQYYGNGRGNQNSMQNDIPSPSKKKEKVDYATSVVANLHKELNLDGLQQAAIKSIINDHKNSLEEIQNMDIPYPEKKGKMEVVNDKISSEILKLLSASQSEKFLKMKEDLDKKALTR